MCDILDVIMKRRDFLRKAAIAAALGLSVGQVVGTLVRSPLKISPYKVSTENGNYVFTLGVHGVEGVTPGQHVLLPEGVKQWNGYFLETGGLNYLDYKDKPGEFVEYLKQYGFYEKLIPSLLKENIPILFGDLPPQSVPSLMVAGGKGIVEAAALVGGVFAATGKESMTMNRREFAKIGLGTLVGAWGLSGFSNYIIPVLFPESIRQPWTKKLREIVSFNELIHPEGIIRNVRNAVIAKKLLYFSKELKIHNNGEKPTIGIAMGGDHEFISEYLKRGEGFCMDVLNIYPESVLKKIFGNDVYREYFPIMTEVMPKEAGQSYEVRMIVDPEINKRVGNLEREGIFSFSEQKG